MSNLTFEGRPAPEIQLRHLGHLPYVIAEFSPDESDDADLQMHVVVGGGLKLADLRETLSIALELVDAAIEESAEAASRLNPKEKA